MTQRVSELHKSVLHSALILSSILHPSLGSVGSPVPSYSFLQYFVFFPSSHPSGRLAVSVTVTCSFVARLLCTSLQIL